MQGVTKSSGIKYYEKKFLNLNCIYWVLLNTVLKLFHQVYMKKKGLFSMCRTLLDIIITVQK